jgi:hypothetical protein
MANTVQLQITANNAALGELTKTKEAIVALSTTASSSIGGLQGLGGALTKMERREPALVLRELRTTLVGLGAESIGTTGPLGRLAVTLTSFGVGGAVGLAAIGGLAGIGFEIKKLVDLGGQMDERLQKVNERFAQMVPAAAALSRVNDLRQQVADLEKAGTVEAISGGPNARTRHPDDVTLAMRIERESQLATARNELAQSIRDFQRTQAGQLAAGETKRADELRKRNEALALQPLQSRGLFLPGYQTAGERALAGFDTTVSGLRNQTISSGNIRQRGEAAFLEQERTRGAQITQEALTPLQLFTQRMEELRQLFETGSISAQTRTQAEKKYKDELDASVAKADKAGSVASISAGFAIGRSLLTSGNGAQAFGGVTSGIGGLLAKSNPVLSAVFSGISGLSSLFGGSSGVKVNIRTIEEQALDQLRHLIPAAQVLSVNIVSPGGQVKDVQYALNRATRLDSIPRLPGV